MSEEELARERDGDVGSLQGILMHISVALWAWGSWRDRAAGEAKASRPKVIAAIRESYERVREKLREFVASLTARLDE